MPSWLSTAILGHPTRSHVMLSCALAASSSLPFFLSLSFLLPSPLINHIIGYGPGYCPFPFLDGNCCMKRGLFG